MKNMISKILAAGSLIALAGCMEPTATLSPPTNVTQISLSSSDWQRVQKAVQARLVDPESARFGPRVAVSARERGKDVKVVCGYVNARNRMGGYVGDQSYIAIFEDGGWGATAPSKFGAEVCRRSYGVEPPNPATRF